VPGENGVIVTKTELNMGYLQPQPLKDVAHQYPVEFTPVEAHKELDTSILHVEGNPGDKKKWGTIKLSARTPGARNSLLIIHHPNGGAQRLTRGRCQTKTPPIDGIYLRHRCDTQIGSSGAPIYDNNMPRRVIGMHSRYVRNEPLNLGIRIASIAKNSSIIAGLLAKEDATIQGGKGEDERPSLSDAKQKWEQLKEIKNIPKLKAICRQFGEDNDYCQLAKHRINELEVGNAKQWKMPRPPQWNRERPVKDRKGPPPEDGFIAHGG
jgi:hypothetical protein